jgi:hypothetical protein
MMPTRGTEVEERESESNSKVKFPSCRPHENFELEKLKLFEPRSTPIPPAGDRDCETTVPEKASSGCDDWFAIFVLEVEDVTAAEPTPRAFASGPSSLRARKRPNRRPAGAPREVWGTERPCRFHVPLLSVVLPRIYTKKQSKNV